MRTVASGRISSTRATTAGGWSNTSPDLAIITGSTTTGAATRRRPAATAATIAGENSMPTLTAPTAMSARTASSWAETIAGATSATAVTAQVFWAVIAVTTEAP